MLSHHHDMQSHARDAAGFGAGLPQTLGGQMQHAGVQGQREEAFPLYLV